MDEASDLKPKTLKFYYHLEQQLFQTLVTHRINFEDFSQMTNLRTELLNKMESKWNEVTNLPITKLIFSTKN